jgi:hypothetical protein
MADALALAGEEREVALAEAQTVRTMAQDEHMRERLAELVAAIDEGDVADGSTDLLESVLELGLHTGRIRALYGPGGEQAALKTLRRLPRGRLRSESAGEVSAALQALRGKPLDTLRVTAVAPGAFTLVIRAGGVEASVRLDQNGARVTSIGT